MTTLSEVAARRHMPALDGLRAVAVGVVIVYHGGMLPIPGDLGVTGFFVLSGFLITTLMLREHDRTGEVSLRQFYLRRTLRIFPAYYAFIAIALAWDLFRRDTRVFDVLGYALAYLMNYYNALNGHPLTTFAHAWSLAIEEQFYLLWPALFIWAMRRRPQGVLRLSIAVVLLVVILRSIRFLGGRIDEAYAYNAFDTRLDSLLVGCALAAVARRGVPASIERLLHAWWGPAVTIGVLMLVRVQLPQAFHYSAGFTAESLLIALLIAQLLLVHEHALWRWLGHPVTRYLGALSYSLYLYHGYGLSAAKRLEPMIGAAHHAAGLVVALLLAMFSYHLIEMPFLRLKDRFAGGTGHAALPREVR